MGTTDAAVAPKSGRNLADAPDLPARLRKPRLRRGEAVEYLELAHGISLSVRTLEKLAATGGGPPFARFNRTPFYGRVDLDVWIDAKLVVAAVRPSEPKRAAGGLKRRRKRE